MKKICFFSGDITRSGGTERVSIMIANELAKLNQYEICFLSLCEQKNIPFYELNQSIKRYKLGEKWLKTGLGYIPLIPKLRRFIKEKEIDLIIDIDIVLDVLSIPATRGIKCKVFSWEHFSYEYEMSIFYRRCIAKYFSRHANYFVTLAQKDYIKYCQLFKRTENIDVIYNPINLIEKPLEEKKENWIVTACRLVPEKGIDYLATVATSILQKYPNWKWFVLGEGVDRPILEEAVKRHRLEEQLILSGLVKNVDEYLSKAKLVVLTSRAENLPMCLLEGKEHGLPCVSFAVSAGIEELIQNNVDGYLIEPFNTDEMIVKLEKIIEDETLRSQFMANSKDNMEKFYLENVVIKWQKVINRLCS